MTPTSLCFMAAVLVALFSHRLTATDLKPLSFSLLEDGLPVLLVTTVYSLLLLITGRPVFSLTMASGGAMLLWVINSIKLSGFQEPLMFMDGSLIPQIARHPRFYLPYLLPLPVLGGLTGIVIVLAVMLILGERVSLGGHVFAGVLLTLSMLVWAALIWSLSPSGRDTGVRILEYASPSLDLHSDLKRFGLLASMYLHGLWHQHRRGRDGAAGIDLEHERTPRENVWKPGSLAPLAEPRPHVVLVQAESFFDIRRALPSLDSGLFGNYDALAKEALSGELAVAASGAYTMRTEFSVLTGVPMARVGTDALNPYFTAARRPVWSLARHLRRQGYRTVCVHPFSLWFFKRYNVMPNLGFDELHGEGYFSQLERYGPYVSDKSVAAYVLDLLRKEERPTFVFAITIEAHGPWDRRRVRVMPEDAPVAGVPEWCGKEFDIYLRHLRNADRMIGALASGLANDGKRPAGLCVYGDHVGSMPRVYAKTNYTNRNTDYLIWRNDTRVPLGRRDLGAAELGGVLLELLGRQRTVTDHGKWRNQ